MYPSTSSYRSSNSVSLRLRRILRNQQELSTPTSSATMNTNATDETTDAHETDVRSRGYSHDYSASGKSSSASVASSTTGEQQQRKQKQKLSNLFSESSSPGMVYFRTLFLRCFTTRRKKRMRGLATRKMKNNNYQTRDDNDCGNVNVNGNGNLHGSANPQRKTYASSIPTNEHEMFFALHSKSKSKRNININNMHTHALHTHTNAHTHPDAHTHTQLLSISSSSQSPTHHRHNRARSSTSGSNAKQKLPTESITFPTLVIVHQIEGQPVLLS